MWLGIDIGTSSVKALLIDDSGAIIADASSPLRVERPQPLWSEQNPDDWVAATTAAVSALPAPARAQVRAIGLSGQMHGATLLDAADKPLRPAILWNDGRAFAECAALEQREPRLRSLSGNAAMPGFTAPKLAWVKAHEPATFAATRTVLLPKDYVRLALTGDKASDMSDAAGTLWLDVAARAWSAPLLEACDLDTGYMPRVYEGSDITGQLSAAAAAKLGVPRVPVVAGAGDNAASAIGIGAINDGHAFLSLGTSGVIFRVTDDFAPAPDRGVHAFCHALPQLWHQMAVILSAASAVDSVARMAGFATTAAAVADLGAARNDDPLFLPYLSGERTPHNNANASGVMFGLTHTHDSSALMRAALEGVAFALADGLDALGASALRELTVVGGGARIAAWGPILASALNQTLSYRDGGEVGAALGAARLAAIGMGSDAHTICTPGALLRSIDPDPALRDRMAPRRRQFQRLYSDLKSAFQEQRA